VFAPAPYTYRHKFLSSVAGIDLMNIFGIGLPEMGLIMIVALLVFGPKKLPEIGRSLGKALKGFQDASKEFEKVVAEPMKATLEKPRALAPDAGTSSSAAEPTEAQIVEEAAEEVAEQVADKVEQSAEVAFDSSSAADDTTEAA
jgi:sec-independent protein translocase protein TatA